MNARISKHTSHQASASLLLSETRKKCTVSFVNDLRLGIMSVDA